MKRGRKTIPTTGLFARYMTIGKNDCGTRIETKDFGQDAAALINQMSLIRDMIGIDEVSVKIYYNGKKILDGEAWEVATLPQVKALLPQGFKSIAQIGKDNHNAKVARLNEGTELQSVYGYKGDILIENETWRGHKRPTGLLNVTWKSPFTITFSKKQENTTYEFESPTYWTVVEEADLLELKLLYEGVYRAIIPHFIYTLPLDKLMFQEYGHGFGVDKCGRLIVNWVD